MRKIIQKLRDLQKRASKHKEDQIDRNLYKLICDREMLEIAYNNIKSQPGSMTPGVSPETLDGISIEALEEISNKLKTEKFQFRTSRRATIPKPSGGSRPITVSPPRDKIVQEAMRMILEAIYEPTFSEHSHGFRPKRGCHTALKHVSQKFQSTV